MTLLNALMMQLFFQFPKTLTFSCHTAECTLIEFCLCVRFSYEHIQTIWVACHWLAMSNSCYNPIVYCWMSDKFRTGFYQAFRWCPCLLGRRSMSYAGGRLSTTVNGREMSMTAAATPPGGGISRTQRGTPMVMRYMGTMSSASRRTSNIEVLTEVETASPSPYATRRQWRLSADRVDRRPFCSDAELYDGLMTSSSDAGRRTRCGKENIEEFKMTMR